jgi:hypothetical protein
MALKAQNVDQRKIEQPQLFDFHRHAHRVFLERKEADCFNPFRHIPWDYKYPKDIETGGPATRHVKESKRRKTISFSTILD